MAIRFLHLRPMRILVDRSHDMSCGWAMVNLAPQATFAATDNRLALTSSLLRGYDVLSIVGVSTAPYSPTEIRAIDGFVRRGGTLMLASHAGQFDMATHRPITALTHQAIAECFGYRFEAPDGLPMDQDGLRGFDREQLAMTVAGQAMGLEAGDLPVARPGWLTTPQNATDLVTAGPDQKPVIAFSSFGKGLVLVCHDTAILSAWNGFIPAHFLAEVDPAGRVTSRREHVRLIPDTVHEQKHGTIRLTWTGRSKPHRQRVLSIARRVLAVVIKLMPPAKPLKRWTVDLVSGCGNWTDWGDPQHPDSHIGVDQSDESLTRVLATQLLNRLTIARLGWEVRTMAWAIQPVLVGLALRKLDHHKAADSLDDAIRQHPTFAPALDLSRTYSEVDRPASLSGLMFELVQTFGDDIFTRMVKGIPRKDAFKHIDWRLHREMDVLAWWLAQVVGSKVYAFLRQRGHTAREIPPIRPATPQLYKAIGAALGRLLLDRAEPASDRYDAASNLAERMGEDLKTDDKLAGRLTSAKPADRLAAAVRLVQRRDARGVEPLRAMLSGDDPGLRGVAALALVCECRDPAAADTLAEVTPSLDTRFQLAAGYALTQMGDARGEPWTFARHPACSMKLHGRGQVRANPCVDGYEVANVYSTPLIRPTQYGGGFSVYYVDWVHTHPRWRRRGIARAGMDAGLDWHWDRQCAATSLHTGTRNVAHQLYRDYDLDDYFRGLRFEAALRPAKALAPPRGVAVSIAEPSQRAALQTWAIGQLAARPDHLSEVGRGTATSMDVRATCRGKTVGYTQADVSHDGKSASLVWLAFTPPPEPRKAKKGAAAKGKPQAPLSPKEHVGQAVLTRLHAELYRRGVRKVEWYIGRPLGEPDTAWLLRRCGYGTVLGGGVELYRINSFAQFLSEIRPTLQARLDAAKDLIGWTGRLTLRTDTQQATIAITDGKVSVPNEGEATPSATDITLQGDRSAIQRLAMGVTSAFEEIYQTNVAITPMLNDASTRLLDVLLPRLTPEA